MLRRSKSDNRLERKPTDVRSPAEGRSPGLRRYEQLGLPKEKETEFLKLEEKHQKAINSYIHQVRHRYGGYVIDDVLLYGRGLTVEILHWYIERLLYGNNTFVKSVDINGNRLTTIPLELANLGSIRTIYANNNLIQSLPDSFFLTFVFLRILNLSDNQLTELPDDIGKFGLLQELRFSNNKIKRLPKSMEGLSRLEDLHCWRNQGLGDFQVEITYSKDQVQSYLAEYFMAERCRTVTLLIVMYLGRHYPFIGKDVITMIGRQIYATRNDAAWKQIPKDNSQHKKLGKRKNSRAPSLARQNSKCALM